LNLSKLNLPWVREHSENQALPVTDEIRNAFSSKEKCVIIAALNFWFMRGCEGSDVVLKFSRTVPQSRECLSYFLIGSVVLQPQVLELMLQITCVLPDSGTHAMR